MDSIMNTEKNNSSTPISDLKQKIKNSQNKIDETKKDKDSNSKYIESQTEMDVKIIKPGKKDTLFYFIQILAIVLIISIILNFDDVKTFWEGISWVGSSENRISQIKIGLINGFITGFCVLLGIWYLSK